MHGPYSAVIRNEGGVVATLDETEVSEGERVADRFYQGNGIRTLVGFTRAAVFTAGLLLEPDERAAQRAADRILGTGTASAALVEDEEAL